MNQVLSSSREVLTTAPIQATNWASAAAEEGQDADDLQARPSTR